jgi:holo-[acyl-carrier protein] synthase
MRVGLDLVSVADVGETLRSELGHRYLARIYTDAEVADCRTDTGVEAERLAARFAAKEATVKVISRSADDAISLREIEVRRERSGHVRVALHGRAAQLATEAGLTHFELSLTHEAGFAAAVVIAFGGDPSGSATRSEDASGDAAGD